MRRRSPKASASNGGCSIRPSPPRTARKAWPPLSKSANRPSATADRASRIRATAIRSSNSDNAASSVASHNASVSTPCPDLIRASTPWLPRLPKSRKTWMAGSSPAKGIFGCLRVVVDNRFQPDSCGSGSARLGLGIKRLAHRGEAGAQRAAARPGIEFAALGRELFAEAEARALRGMAGGAMLVAAHSAAALLHQANSARHIAPDDVAVAPPRLEPFLDHALHLRLDQIGKRIAADVDEAMRTQDRFDVSARAAAEKRQPIADRGIF